MRFRFHHNPDDAGIGPLLTAKMLRNPLDGNYTVEDDREAVVPVLKLIAERFAEYARSGSDAWDATLDVHKRPAWLKELAGVDEGFPESPHVNPKLAGAASLSRLFRPAVVNHAAQAPSNGHLSYNKVSPDGDEEGACEVTEITTIHAFSGDMAKAELDLEETQLSR